MELLELERTRYPVYRLWRAPREAMRFRLLWRLLLTFRPGWWHSYQEAIADDLYDGGL